MATVVADRATVFTDTALERHPYFSWGAAVAGALAGAMVAFTLLAIGTGLGLVFVGPVNDAAPVKTILTAGGLYFFAVVAFGFAVGGYVAGRLCGPVLQARDEEMFRSGAHGLVVWALISAAVVVFLTIGAAVATAAAGSAASMLGITSTAKADGETESTIAAYWADTLLRVQAASAAPVQSAPGPQAAPVTPLPDTTPPAAPDLEVTPVPAPGDSPAPSGDTIAPSEGESGSGDNGSMTEPGTDEPNTTGTEEMPPPVPSPAVYAPATDRAALLRVQYTTTTTTAPMPQITTIAASRRIDPEARAEITHILSANALAPHKMPAEDRRQIERIVAEQTGVSPADAGRRVDALLSRVRAERMKAAETARKAGAYIHIWLGLSLFFGLLVSTAAAVLARMEDEDKAVDANPRTVAVRVDPVIQG